MAKSAKRQSKKKQPISGDDLFKLRIPTGVAISPHEDRAVFAVERMDKEDNKYFKNLVMLDLSSGEQRPYTHGKQNDQVPVWSHDGSRLAFVSTRDKKTGIYVMPAGGGAERKVIDLDGSIANLQWTPDDSQLVFALRYNDSHFEEDEDKKGKPPVYRHITRLFYRYDALGFVPKDPFQIYRLEVESGELHKITKGKRDNTQPHVSPDGKWLCYVSNRQKDPDLELLKDDLFVQPLTGGREKKIATPAGPIMAPKFSPDGKTIAYIGHDRPDDGWGVANQRVWKVGVSGSPKARDLMPEFDRMAMDLSITDVGDASFSGTISWSADGKRIYFLGSDTGATNLFYVPAKGGKPTRIFKGKCHIKGFSLAGKTRTAALIHADLKSPGEVVSCPTTFGAEAKAVYHTKLNQFLNDDVKLGRVREVFFKSFDGTEVQGWLVTPPDFKTTKKYPSILEIHGGPRVQYAHSFMHEMQYLAAKGYVVFYTNPRGGQGRGETWAAAIMGGWGDLDYRDCMAAADWLETQKYIDPKRMGVTGGSYGGYMTSWIIGHTDRFRAAVTQRAVNDLRSMFGSSDIGWDIEREFDGWPWTNPENYTKCSPLTYMSNVKTPVLIIHSEQDLRCNIEQADSMFAWLKVMGKTVEYVRFPEEPHGLSRHGRPDRRIARLEWIDKWFSRYLKK